VYCRERGDQVNLQPYAAEEVAAGKTGLDADGDGAVGAAHGRPGHRQDRGDLDVERAVLGGGPRGHRRRGDQLAHRHQVLLVRQALEGAADQVVARGGTHAAESTDLSARPGGRSPPRLAIDLPAAAADDEDPGPRRSPWSL